MTSHRPGRPAARPALEQLEDRALLSAAIAVTAANQLLQFDTTTPGTIAATLPITGLQGGTGEAAAGVSVRADTGAVTLLTATPNTGLDALRLYTLNPVTGAATFVGVGGTLVGSGDAYGFAYNTAATATAEFRYVNSTANQNGRLDANTAALTADTPLTPANEKVVAVGYTPQSLGTATLYGLSRDSNYLVRIGGPGGSPSANLGRVSAVGPLGVTLSAAAGAGFDVDSSGAAEAVLTVGPNAVTGLYTIDLTKGTATLVGRLGAGATPVTGFTVLPTPVVSLSAAAYSVVSDAGPAEVTVSRTAGVGAFTVQFTLTPGTARPGTDYTDQTQTLTFSAADTTKTIDVPVLTNPAATTNRVLTLTLSDPTGDAALGAISAATLTIVEGTGTSPPSPPVLLGSSVFTASGGAGANGVVTAYHSDGTQLGAFDPFFGYTGGVRTAVADFNGDGVPDYVVGTGPGVASQVYVLNGVNTRPLFAVTPFESSYTGGVFVAAGDVTGDGTPDLIITPDVGGGPRVRVFNGKTFAQIADFLGIADANFRGGARAAVGDINGDGKADLVVAAGSGGGPRVAAYSGASLMAGSPVKLFADFLAFEPTLRDGTYVAVGDVNGDGKADVIVGGGPGGGPRVTVYSGAGLLSNAQIRVADFFAGDPTARGGARVVSKDLDGDTLADLVVGAGEGSSSLVRAYRGQTLLTANPIAAYTLDAIPDFTGGVYVG